MEEHEFWPQVVHYCIKVLIVMFLFTYKYSLGNLISFKYSLYEDLQELDRLEGSLVDGVVLIVALVDLLRPLRHQVLDTVPRTPFTRNVQQRPLLLPRQPVILCLLH